MGALKLIVFGLYIGSKIEIQNHIDAFCNLATRSMHAKYQLIWAIRLARAMGVVRKLTAHLTFGGTLYVVT